MKRALGVNGGTISNQKIADEIVTMAHETPDWLASDPCPGRGITGAILRGSRSAQFRSAYSLSRWLRWRQQQLEADDPSQDQSQDQGDDQDLEDQGDDQDLEDKVDDQDLEDIRPSHSQCMSQEVFEEALDDLIRVQWAMAWLPPVLAGSVAWQRRRLAGRSRGDLVLFLFLVLFFPECSCGDLVLFRFPDPSSSFCVDQFSLLFVEVPVTRITGAARFREKQPAEPRRHTSKKSMQLHRIFTAASCLSLLLLF
jgi:hypothetical protein